MPKFKRPFALIALVVVAASLAGAQQHAVDQEVPLVQLFKQREDTLKKLVDIARLQYEQGQSSLQSLNAAEKQLLDARLESATNPLERIEILKSQLGLAINREEAIAKMVKAAILDPTELMEATVERLNMQIALRKERQK